MKLIILINSHELGAQIASFKITKGHKLSQKHLNPELKMSDYDLIMKEHYSPYPYFFKNPYLNFTLAPILQSQVLSLELLFSPLDSLSLSTYLSLSLSKCL
jgi:hypothetical protein